MRECVTIVIHSTLCSLSVLFFSVALQVEPQQSEPESISNTYVAVFSSRKSLGVFLCEISNL